MNSAENGYDKNEMPHNWQSTAREDNSMRTNKERRKAAEELFKIEAPVGDWEEMKREISDAYAKTLADA